MFEINDIIANQIKLPYSTGLIWSYCILNEEVKNNYDLAGWFYYREDQEDILAKVKELTASIFIKSLFRSKF